MSGNIFAVAICLLCCLELVRYFTAKSVGRVFDVSILPEGNPWRNKFMLHRTALMNLS